MVEKRYRTVRIAILLLFQKCNAPSVRTGLPNLLFNYWALSAVIRRKRAGGAAALDLKCKLLGFLITFFYNFMLVLVKLQSSFIMNE